jgi:endonuclease IV
MKEELENIGLAYISHSLQKKSISRLKQSLERCSKVKVSSFTTHLESVGG